MLTFDDGTVDCCDGDRELRHRCDDSVRDLSGLCSTASLRTIRSPCRSGLGHVAEQLSGQNLFCSAVGLDLARAHRI